mmetsp:Transcript_12270/g.12019  ORF Transcript_12270/g.12019 Transcript_12270/m.12019 type:complete len:109 (-) Transcript_12270:313-639(-)
MLMSRTMIEITFNISNESRWQRPWRNSKKRHQYSLMTLVKTKLMIMQTKERLRLENYKRCQRYWNWETLVFNSFNMNLKSSSHCTELDNDNDNNNNNNARVVSVGVCE